MKSPSITHQLFYPKPLNLFVFRMHFKDKSNSFKEYLD